MKYIIVGIDPGTTAGVCVLDLDGALVKIYSKKNFSLGGVLKFLESCGDVVVVSCDVNPVPNFVDKIAARFNAVIYVPERVVSVAEKNALKNEFLENGELRLKNKHERDALASALLAHTSYKNTLHRIDMKMIELGIEDLNFISKVKKVVLHGVSISRALKLVGKDI